MTIRGAYPRSKVCGGLQNAALGGDSAEDEVGPAGPSHQFCGLGGEQRVSGLVDACVRVARRLGELGNDVGLRWFLEPTPLEQPLVGAVGIVEVPGEDDRAPGGGPSGDEVGDCGHDMTTVVVQEPFCMSITNSAALLMSIGRRLHRKSSGTSPGLNAPPSLLRRAPHSSGTPPGIHSSCTQRADL